MVKRLLLVASCLASVGTVASAQVLELEGRYWPATLTATVRVTGDHAEVPSDLSTIDLKSDLGLKDKNGRDHFRVGQLSGQPIEDLLAPDFAIKIDGQLPKPDQSAPSLDDVTSW